MYFANSDYVPTRPDGIALAENQLVDVIDAHDPEQYLVRTRPRKDERPKIGWVESCFLEKKSTNIGQVSEHNSYLQIWLLSLLLLLLKGDGKQTSELIVYVRVSEKRVLRVSFSCFDDKQQVRRVETVGERERERGETWPLLPALTHRGTTINSRPYYLFLLFCTHPTCSLASYGQRERERSKESALMAMGWRNQEKRRTAAMR